MRFESDSHERGRQNAAGLLPDWAREQRESERAVREAERVLAESEGGPFRLYEPHRHSFKVDDRLPAGTGEMWDSVQALASALTAVLPVLDELAYIATHEAFYGAPDKATRMQVSFMYERNQRNSAALAAMDQTTF